MTNVLHAAVATNITSVAVCALGSGIFGWDAKLAREVLVRATFAWECARLIRPCTVITVVFFDMSHTGTAFFGTAVSTALREARAAARAPLLPIPSIELSTADSLCVRDQVKLTEPARRTVQYLLHALLACMRTQLTVRMRTQLTERTPLVIHCQLLETSAPADEILCALFKIDVTRASMRTLAPNTWLVCDVRNNDPLLLYIYFYNFS